jgi:hypothetical protein
VPKQARQTRENRTITIDFPNKAPYVQLLGDGKAFVECVVAFILSLAFQLTHKATCRGGGWKWLWALPILLDASAMHWLTRPRDRASV